MPANRQEVLAAAAADAVADERRRKDAAQLPRHSHTVNVVYWRPMLTVRLCLGGCQPSHTAQYQLYGSLPFASHRIALNPIASQPKPDVYGMWK